MSSTTKVVVAISAPLWLAALLWGWALGCHLVWETFISPLTGLHNGPIIGETLLLTFFLAVWVLIALLVYDVILTFTGNT